jgi:UDP-3-O-[3-hydroxymyristoyl] glucosamine N-acyltransferase
MIPAGRRTVTLAELARELGLEHRGDGGVELSDVAELTRAGEGALAALYDSRQAEAARASRAAALVVDEGAAEQLAGRNLLLARTPKAAFARATTLLRPAGRPETGVHPTAAVSPEAELAEDVHVGPGASIGAGCRVGRASVVAAGAVLLDEVTLGEEVWVHPRAVVYPHTEIGDRVQVFAGAVIGAPGFGHAHDESGRAVRIPHLGRVVVEADAEIGANACIDRASFGETRIGARAKLDNLVQIGHNASVGPDAMIAGQSGLSGSSCIERGVVVGGQSGVADHVTVGERSAVAAKSAVFQDVGPGEVVAGVPAQPISRWRRMVAAQAKLPELWSAVRRLGKEKDGS